MSRTKKPYECCECNRRFSEEDAARYTYFRHTKTCFDCYQEGQKKDHRVWCFGKRDKLCEGVTVRWGYDATRPECSSKCPDRKICLAFQWRKKDGKRYRKIDLIRIKRAQAE